MGTADTAQPINGSPGLNPELNPERFAGIREVMSTTDSAQASIDFTKHKSRELFTSLCEGRRKFFQQLRTEKGIPENICAWCAEKPARPGHDTCRDCAEASAEPATQFAIKAMAPG